MEAGTVAAVVLGVLASGAAVAATDGNELLSYCKQAIRLVETRHADRASSDIEIGQCFGIMEGVRSTMMLMDQGPKAGRVACWPENGITNGQAARIVIRYLDNHPAKLNEDRVLLSILAFSDAYPCK